MWALEHEREAERARAAKEPVRKQWHASRAAAHRERIERVEKCGRGAVVVSCSNCRKERTAVAHKCRQPHLCKDCRKDYQGKYRARLTVAIRREMHRARHAGLFHLPKRVRAGAKFITLTPPHSGSASIDAATITRAERRFRRRLNDYLERDLGWPKREARYRYVRRLEGTGSDGGHMHFHVWAILPYVPQALLAHWWGIALLEAGAKQTWPMASVDDVTCSTESARAQLRAAAVTRRGPHGRPVLELHRPILDVRAAKSAEGAAAELAKYLLKDIDDNGNRLHPRAFARVFAAFKGRRSIAASRGMLAEPAPENPPHCEHCGCVDTLRVLDESRTLNEPRGPPHTLSCEKK